jgi:hypothetical protein
MAIGLERVTSDDSVSASPARSETRPADALTRDFIAWLASAPRTYDEVMAAWRTSCPRLSIWEDALADGLVRVDGETGTPAGLARVVVTLKGRELLNGAASGSANG